MCIIILMIWSTVQKLILVIFFSKIRVTKLDEFIISLDGKIKHLVLFDYRLLDKIYDKVKHIISKNNGITKSINYNFGRIRTDSHNSLPINKKLLLPFHNAIILLKSVAYENKNKYYYNIFLEKCLYKNKCVSV